MAARLETQGALVLGVLLAAAVATAEPMRADVPAGVEEALARREYEATPNGRGLQAPNRAHNLRTYFEPAGIRVHDRTATGSPELLGLELAGVGRGVALAPVAAGEVVHEGPRVEIRRPGLVEWYVNSDEGLEQGFTLAERPAGEGELVLELGLAGARASRRGGEIALASDAGRRLTYGKLAVRDARGRALDARLEAPAADRIRLVVADADAAYPIVVDPLLSGAPDAQFESDQATGLGGFAAASAGDVNGDGYADVLFGSSFYDDGESDEGAVFLYLGSSEGIDGGGGGPGSAELVLTGQQAGARFGYAVASAGDVNGDGYDDLIISARLYDAGQSDEGAAFVFHGSPGGPIGNDPASAATQLESDQATAEFGTGVAGAGDVNGDGYADVIVGAFEYDAGNTDEGAAWIFHGSASGVADGNPASANTQLEANQSTALMGRSVASAGDVNGDGYADVIVGAELYDVTFADAGVASIFLGSPTGVANGSPSTSHGVLRGNQLDARMGYSVASVGDVNGDGYSDVMASAPRYDDGEADEGIVSLLFGGPSGMPGNHTPSTAGDNIASDQADALLGERLSQLGDVNGDGYADVAVGAYSYDQGQTDEGCAWVFYGGTDGLTDSPDAETPSTSDVSLCGDQADAAYGSSVGGSGDVNGDGYADLLVSAHLYDAGETDEGAAFVYHGGAHGILDGKTEEARGYFESDQAGAQLGYSVASAGDVNGDGFSDVIVGARHYDAGQSDEGAVFVVLGSSTGMGVIDPLSPLVSMLEGDQVDALLGHSVAAAGDVNGDGYGDVIVGSTSYDAPATNEGAAFIFHGSASGIGDGNPASANTRLEGGNQGFALMGQSVASAGDVNGDGYGDVIVGARTYDAGQTNEGAAFVFHGSASGIAHGDPSTAAAQLESDQDDAEFGWSVAGAGDVNGDGFADVIVGAFDYDEEGGTQEGAAFVFHGSASGIGDGTPSTAAAKIEGSQNNTFLGYSVASAGDVNADGYADVIVGGVLFSNGHGNEGVVLIFHGDPSGIADGNPFTADTKIEGGQGSAWLGTSVAAAGDVNGDGYGDVVAGARGFDAGEVNEGGAFIYLGAELGIAHGTAATAAAQLESDQEGSEVGWSAAGAGDVNGDGFADVIVGAQLYDASESDEGGAFVFYGNGNADGRKVALRQQRFPSGSEAPLWGWSEDPDAFRVTIAGTHPAGRARVKLEVLACPQGVSFFDGCPRAVSSVWTESGLPASVVVSDLLGGPLYHWRARLLYAPFGVTQPGITPPENPPHGPWRTLTAAGEGASAGAIRMLLDTDDDEIANSVDADDDDDGLSDVAETGTHGTDPLDPDSDDDGLNDAQEVALGSDPNDADSDDDIFPDGFDNCPLVANVDQLNGDVYAAGDVCQCGDVNGNGKISAADYTRAREYVAGRTPGGVVLVGRCDVTGDAACDVADLALLDRLTNGAAATITYGCEAYTGP